MLNLFVEFKFELFDKLIIKFIIIFIIRYKAFRYDIESLLLLMQLANVLRLIKLDFISVFSFLHIHFSH